MDDLRQALIKLANEKPCIRAEVVPLLRKNAGLRAPSFSARQWQLYEMPGDAKAAAALNRALKRGLSQLKRDLKALGPGRTRRDVERLISGTWFKVMDPAHMQQKAYGAADSEPLHKSQWAFSEGAKDVLGLDVLDELHLDLDYIW